MRKSSLLRTSGAVLISSLLLAPVTQPASAAAAATASSSMLTVAGTVDSASSHLAAGADVQLYAWPSDGVLQALRPGHSVPRKLLATATTGSAGSYTLRVPAGVLHSVANSSGYANLEADSGTGSWFFTRKATDLGTVGSVNIAGASPATCSGWVFQHQVKKAWGTVGQAYILSNATHVHEKFSYAKGQSSTLGVGVSPSGKVGSFSANGSESESKTGSVGFPGFGPSNVLYRTLWRMALYRDLCGRGGKVMTSAVPMGGFKCKDGVCVKYQVRSDGWASGESEVHPRQAPKTPSFDCVPYQAGGSFSTDSERAKTWSGGLSVTALNFSAEAQTGYDTSAQVSFTFGASRALCGTNAVPPAAAQLVAKR